MEASFAPIKIDTIPLLSPTTEMKLMHADSWLQPTAPMNGGLPTPGVRPNQNHQPQQPLAQQPLHHHQPQQQQQQPQPAVVVLTTQIAQINPATLSPGGMEDYQDLSKFMPLQQQCDSLVGESVVDVELNKDMRNDNNAEVSNMWQREIRDNSTMQTLEDKSPNHGDNFGMGVQRSQTATHVPAQLDHAYPLVAGQQQQQQQIYYNNNNNNISNNNNNNNNNINEKSTSGETYIYKNENVWVSPVIKGEQPYLVESSDEQPWTGSNRLGNMTDQQMRTDIMNSEINKKHLNRENSQELLQMLEKADNFDLLSYIGEDDMNLSPDSVSTNYSHLTDSSVPRTPSNSSALVAVSPRTYEPLPLKPSNSIATPMDPLQSRLRATSKDVTRSQENHHFVQDIYRMSDATATTTTGSMGYELRTIKQEKPESPQDELTDLHSIERRSTRQRRTRVNSNVSQTSSTCSSSGRSRGRKRSRDDDSDDDEIYRETREKNNEASRKSRMNKKQKEQEMSVKAAQLEKTNKLLKMKVEHMEGVVTMLRNTLLQSALKRGDQKYY